MNKPDRRSVAAPTARTAPGLVAVLILAVLVVACGLSAPSVSPAASIAPSASPPPSDVPSTPPSASAPAAATPSAAPTPTSVAASPSQAAATCGLPQQLILPSDRVVEMTTTSTASSETITFAFGESSLPGPADPPDALLDVARPPFTDAASGQTIDLQGDHVLQLRFNGMSLANDVGDETYQGPRELRPTGSILQHVVLFDESEGVIGWYLGYNGGACVTMAASGSTVTVTFAHS
jgi:hypothetical protein